MKISLYSKKKNSSKDRKVLKKRIIAFYEITADEIKDAMRHDWPFDEKKPIFVVTLDNDIEFYTIAPETVEKKILSRSKGNLFCVILVDEEKGRFKNYVASIYEDKYIDIDFTDEIESQDDQIPGDESEQEE